MKTFVLTLFFVGITFADVYMNNPRGSNNRLNEQTATRTNGNRLFNSQNNNRGGYNVGDKTSQAFSATQPFYPPQQTYDVNEQTTAMQYQMVFFEGSVLPIEWTVQHGCGGRESAALDFNGNPLPQQTTQQNCDMVVQYTCDTNSAVTDMAMQVMLRDGGNTNTPDAPASATTVAATMASNIANFRGHQESEMYYYECTTRSRQKGLFTADQNLNGQTARFTRQNPNGNRNGLECPEERDYYPYWGPSPWIDVAYLTDHLEYCSTVLTESQNTNMKYKCLYSSLTADNVDAQINAITESACTAAQGTWVGYTHNVLSPVCRSMEFSRPNSLGNGVNGQMVGYNWTLPLFSMMSSDTVFYNAAGNPDASSNGKYAKCALRIRYNISTDDYNPLNTTARNNHNPNAGTVSPVTQNPTVDVGADLQGLQLAVNTAQFGRTFEDRSHIFYIKAKTANVAGKDVFNLNVRGKRGNIVQTFPAHEYDFVPNSLHIGKDQRIHLQWTGSNTHNNGGDGGDGQAGDAGEGRGGTDRHNFVLMQSRSENFPIPLDMYPNNLFNSTVCWDEKGVQIPDALSCALILATSGQFRTPSAATDDPTVFSPLLDLAPASLIGGVVMDITNAIAGEYNYMCTRNNNFSNRSQKGTIMIENNRVDPITDIPLV